MKEIVQMILDFTAESENRGIAVVIVIGMLSTALVKIMLFFRNIFKDYLEYLLKKRKKKIKEDYKKFLKYIMDTHTDQNGHLKLVENDEEFTIDKIVKKYLK